MKVAFDYRAEWNKWFVYVYDDKFQYEIEIKRDPIEPGMTVKEAAQLSKEDLNAFSNAMKTAMIESGFLQESASLEGELKATKGHLDDMRKLVFDYSNQRIFNG